MRLLTPVVGSAAGLCSYLGVLRFGGLAQVACGILCVLSLLGVVAWVMDLGSLAHLAHDPLDDTDAVQRDAEAPNAFLLVELTGRNKGEVYQTTLAGDEALDHCTCDAGKFEVETGA